MSKAAYTRDPNRDKPSAKSGRMGTLLSELRWLMLVAVTTFLAMILLSYSPLDPAWSQSNEVGQVVNLGGRVGAWCADLLLFVFGKSAWWWFLLLAMSVVRSYSQIGQQKQWQLSDQQQQSEHHYPGWLRGVGFVLILSSSMGIEYLRMYSYHFNLPRAPGGVLGELIGNAAFNSLGFTGATLFLLLLMGVGISALFQVSWLTLAEKIGTNLELSIAWIIKKYTARQDRLVGQVAAIAREESDSFANRTRRGCSRAIGAS
jgi:DNA segregation ATPase FtsK/SpoIIIE, S-DNA-T family